MTQRVGLTTRAEREALRSIKRVCYAGLDSVTLRQEVGRRAAAMVPAEAYALMATDPETGLFTHGWAEGLPESFIQSYIGDVYPNEVTEFLDLARSGLTTSTNNSEAYMEVLRADGLEHTVHTVLCVEEEMWGSWCIFRESASRGFGEKEMRFLRAVAPHVARGIKSAAAIEVAMGVAPPLDSSAPGVLVLDARSHITLRSGPVAAQLNDLNDLGITVEKKLPYAVISVLARLRATSGCDADPLPLSAELRAQGRSGRWYTLRASLAEPNAWGESATVIIIEPATPREAGPFLQAYGLTPREREVLGLAVRGDSTKRIAAQLGVSTYTVQDHLDNACEKVGVRGRKALLAKIFFDGYAAAGSAA